MTSTDGFFFPLPRPSESSRIFSVKSSWSFAKALVKPHVWLHACEALLACSSHLRSCSWDMGTEEGPGLVLNGLAIPLKELLRTADFLLQAGTPGGAESLSSLSSGDHISYHIPKDGGLIKFCRGRPGFCGPVGVPRGKSGVHLSLSQRSTGNLTVMGPVTGETTFHSGLEEWLALGSTSGIGQPMKCRTALT